MDTKTLYFDDFFPSWLQKISAWVIILMSAITSYMPMFQSGLLFTTANPSCLEVEDYCQCNMTTYNHPFWSDNVISEFDLICDNEEKVGLSDICFFAGKLASGLVGFFLDNFSRKWTWLTMQALLVLSTALQSSAGSIEIYSIYRFVQGFICQLVNQERDSRL